MPVSHNGHLAEPITWRDDLFCGSDYLNLIGTAA